MIRMRLNVWAFGAALGFAVLGSMASPKARAQDPPVKPGGRQPNPDKGERSTPRKVVVTNPLATDVVVTQPYTGQIRAQRHIDVRTLSAGALEAVPVREGQAVKQGDVLFKIVPTLYKAKLDAELAEVKLADIELENNKKLFNQKVVAQQQVALSEAKLALAQARAKLAEGELEFTTVKAPFDGLLGRLNRQEGSLVDGKDVLTTLSDNSVMWVYFHVPEARYLEYRAREGKSKDPSRLELVDSRIELVLADASKFKQDAGNTVTVEGAFNNETGNIAFRADFPNPDRLLRHGQTGTVSIRRTVKNATVIPQRATFEVLDRRYVYVVDKENVVHQRAIVVEHEVDDIFVVQKGLDLTDKIVLEGIRQLRDGDKVETVFRKPEEVYESPKRGAEK
jgi:membrane fusion protein (multidrug efflux system)